MSDKEWTKRAWIASGAVVLLFFIGLMFSPGGPGLSAISLIGFVFVAAALLVGLLWLVMGMGKVGWVVFGLGLFGATPHWGNWPQWGSFVVFYLILALILGYGWQGLVWAGRKFNEWQGPPPERTDGPVQGD